MFMHLAEAVQPAPKHRLHFLLIEVRELMLDSHSHALTNLFVKLSAPTHLSRQWGTPRPPHLVGVDRIGQSFDVFFHGRKLTRTLAAVKHTLVLTR